MCINKKDIAEYFLHKCGLLDELKKYGTPHIIGSYKMDLMACNDLDIDIENSGMSLEKLYKLTAFILERFKPVWYEAKEEINDEGKKVWFHGFETLIMGELWNFDLWFFDKETIEKAEAFCDDVSKKVEKSVGAREAILDIKTRLIEKGLYSFEHYNSMDVYKAVLECGIKDADTFLREYKKEAVV